MGSIYKKKWKNKEGKTVEGKTWWLAYYDRGKLIRESSKSKKKMVAGRLLKQREGDIALGKTPGVFFEKTSFKDITDNFIQDYEINQRKSLARAKRSVAHLEKYFKDINATAITTKKIQNYILYRQSEGAANASINRELSALKRSFNLAAKDGSLGSVPYVPRLKENNVRTGFFEHDEFLALQKALPKYLKGMATFAYTTGWRVGEITTLQWPQIDLKQGIVRLEAGMTKNDDARTVYLDEELKEVFQNQWLKRKETSNLIPYVFTNKDGTGKIKDFRGAWSTACKEAKLGKKLFHDLRRTGVRNMVRAGVPERVAMMISGHKTRSVFDRYNIVSDSDLKMAAGKQGEYKNSQACTNSCTVVDFEAKKGLTKIG